MHLDFVRSGTSEISKIGHLVSIPRCVKQRCIFLLTRYNTGNKFSRLSSTEIFCASEIDKLHENLRESLQKNQSFVCRPTFLKQLLHFNQSSLNKLLYVSAFYKYIISSCRVSISRVIPIYTWDTFLGHPVFHNRVQNFIFLRRFDRRNPLFRSGEI